MEGSTTEITDILTEGNCSMAFCLSLAYVIFVPGPVYLSLSLLAGIGQHAVLQPDGLTWDQLHCLQAIVEAGQLRPE